MTGPNPFTERCDTDAADRELVAAAVDGDRAALENLLLRHQAWIYNLAVRMVWEPTDAEDVTQEVLVKVVTKLSTFRGDAEFRTWLYRMVANHVLNMRRRHHEETAVSFSQFGAQLAAAPELELPDRRSLPVDVPMLVDEAKLGCTIGMIMCLDRRQRLAYVLGELFGASHRIGGELLDTTPQNFRQLLTRARKDLSTFMADTCGLVDPNNPCRCPKKTRAFIEAGYVDPDRMRFAGHYERAVRDLAPAVLESLDDQLHEQARAVQREQPFLESPDVARRIDRMLELSEVRDAMGWG
jgi:RNA polymerase sigma factor (sigma-70 family)